MKRCVTVSLLVSLFFGILWAPRARAQNSEKVIVTAGGLIGGLLGTYSAAVCHEKGSCTAKESWMVLGIYTGAGMGTMALLSGPRGSKKQPTDTASKLNDFSNLQKLLKKGDRISIRDVSGGINEGVIETISGSSLKLQTGGSIREFSDAEVRTIDQRRRGTDGRYIFPVMTASLLGSAIAIPNLKSGNWCTGKGAGTCVIGATALGSVLYLSLSSLPKRIQTIYVKSTPGRIAGINWRVAPLVSKNTRGAVMRVSF